MTELQNPSPAPTRVVHVIPGLYTSGAESSLGFAIPLDLWLRSPLHAWCESMLDEHKLPQDYFDTQVVRRRWHEHLSARIRFLKGALLDP